MYDVIKSIHDLNKIVITDAYQSGQEEIIPLAGSKVHMWGEEIEFPISQFNLEWNKVYNNCTLTNSRMKTELVILQDYGDHKDKELSGWFEINRAIPFTNLDTSIGWYDNQLVLISIFRDTLFVFKLADYPKIQVEKVRSKQPYNFKVLVENNYTSDSPIYLWINIQPGYSENYKVTEDFLGSHFIKTPLTYGKITHPDWLTSALEYYPVNYDMLRNWDENYLRRDDFVINGFSFDSDIKCWIKGNLKVHDNCETAPNFYFWVGSNEMNEEADILFTQADLAKYLDQVDMAKVDSTT